VSQLAGDRLIEAALALAPAERALLNLWLHHGYEDDELARLLATTPEAIAARREAMLETLSGKLGVPHEAVLDGLRELDPRLTVPSNSDAEGAQPPPPANGEPPVHASPPQAEPGATPSAEAPRTSLPQASAVSTPRHRRRPIVWAAGILCLVIVVVVALSAGGSSSHKTASRPASTHDPVASPVARTLVALPGGPAGVAGSLTVRSTPGAATATIRVRGLHAPPGSHYELWLYNSVIDSLPLGAVPPDGVLRAALPSDYRRYRWLDVSWQPRGARVHSGISVLRTAVP
jgi:anti-sigma-K factor RskA